MVESVIEGFTAWKNREQGIGLVNVGPYTLRNVVVLDNIDAGVEVGDVAGMGSTPGRGGMGVLLEDSLVVGHR